jgi:hypothetical protein
MTEHKQPDWTELEAAARDELELIEVVADEIAADFKHTARAKSLRGAASRLLSALRAVEGERDPTNQQDRTPDDVLLVPSDVGGAQPAGPVLGDITGHSRLWHTLQVFARDTGALAGSDVLEWFVTHTDTLKARWNVQDELFERLQAAEARASTAEARVAELVGALEPFANFRLEGFDGEVLEVVPSSPMNPASRIEPVWAGYFRKARAALLSPPPGEEGGRGSSGAERAGAPACGAATAAHSQSEGGAS